MEYNFPFTMHDVCSLISYTHRYSSGDSIYVDCPVCSVHKKGKLNINFRKENFRCNRCDVSGGMLDLYIIFGNANLDRIEARTEIIEKLNKGGDLSSHGNYTKNIINEKVENVERASVEDIDYTYRKLLSLLPLSNIHVNELMRRGLIKEQITRFNFRSVPDSKYIGYLLHKLSEEGCVIKGVPGFHVDKHGNWTMRFSNFLAGIIIPTTGFDGNIHALQIRLDRPFEDDTKYIWFSSATKEQGVSCGSPVNFAGNSNSEVVYVTEGGLKAIIAHCLSGKTFLGNQGANQLCAVNKSFDFMKRNGTKVVVIAYDNDKYKTIEVNEGYTKVIALAKEHGFRVELITWDSAYKGIDDFLLEQAMRKKLLTAV